ncbi:MAG: hypothetical protein ABSG42_08410 [Nitrospirota bacterium]
MEETCEFLEKCGFFINFKGNSEVIRAGWIRLFCQSKGRSEKCERKAIRRKTGSPPPDNMAPTGDMIKVVRVTESGCGSAADD